jgi:putative FmdB family regulatory protein
MPTYEYRCEACGETFEKFQSITASPIRKCPKCGKRRVKRLLGMGAGLIFKGSGFYTTDYRSEGYKSAAKADSGASSSTGSSESKGAEGKAGSSSAASEKKSAPKSESKGAAKKE